jgi:hypothetical protein
MAARSSKGLRPLAAGDLQSLVKRFFGLLLVWNSQV